MSRIAPTQHVMSERRVAIVHDWLLGMRGGERVLEVICEMFPNADIFTAFYNPQKISSGIKKHRIISSAFDKLPNVHSYHRYLLPVYTTIAKDLSNKLNREHDKKPYDLVLSVSHCFAKNVTSPKGVPHLSYCLTPMRYIWDQFEAYFGGRKIEPLAKVVASKLRRWDRMSSERVTKFYGISEFIAKRIERVYQKPSGVIYPPVPTEWIELRAGARPADDFFLVVNALVPYKNTHVIVEAFNDLGLPLKIVGEGPEKKRLELMAASNISFLGEVSDHELSELYRKASAMVFAAEEDFGMTPVEAQASGCPVIALGKGGALETVSARETAASGVFFSSLNSGDLSAAVRRFLDRKEDYTVNNCRKQAELFCQARFEAELMQAFSELIPLADDSKRVANRG